MQFGSSGVGSGSHFSCAKLNAALGIDPTHVPYRGSGLAMQDLVGGRSTISARSARPRWARSKAAHAKAMALLTDERSPLFPKLQTAKEQGIPGVDSYFWTAFFFPKDTPDAIVQKLYDATTQTLKSARDRRATAEGGRGADRARAADAAYLKTFIGTEVDNWAAQIKASGVTIE